MTFFKKTVDENALNLIVNLSKFTSNTKILSRVVA